MIKLFVYNSLAYVSVPQTRCGHGDADGGHDPRRTRAAWPPVRRRRGRVVVLVVGCT